MKAYLCDFIHWELNNRSKLLSMVKFAENKANNTGTGYTYFEPKYDYKPYVFLSMKLICIQNLALSIDWQKSWEN